MGASLGLCGGAQVASAFVLHWSLLIECLLVKLSFLSWPNWLPICFAGNSFLACTSMSSLPGWLACLRLIACLWANRCEARSIIELAQVDQLVGDVAKTCCFLLTSSGQLAIGNCGRPAELHVERRAASTRRHLAHASANRPPSRLEAPSSGPARSPSLSRVAPPTIRLAG